MIFIISIGVLICTSLYLSGSETALTGVNEIKLQSKAQNGDKKAKQLLTFLKKKDQMISSILIGNNAANMALASLVTAIAIKYSFNVAIATLLLTVFMIIFAEVLPKTIAATFPEPISLKVFKIISLLILLCKPVNFLLNKLSRFVISLIAKGRIIDNNLSKEEIKAIVDIASNEGTFHNQESITIKNTIDLKNKDARDVMKTPRTDVVGIPYDATYDDVVSIYLDSEYSRYPVYKENMDNVIGIFNSKGLVQWSLDKNKSLLEHTDQDALFIIESLSVEKVFKSMGENKKHQAIILDEFGGTVGILTHEDILESWLGLEIEDETDNDDASLIEELTDSTIVCNGKLTIHILNDIFKTKLPDDEDTIAGFILKETGEFPNVDDSFTIHDLHIRILKTSENKIEHVKISKGNKDSLFTT